MPIVEVEMPLGVWTRHIVSFEERRALLVAASPEQRFIDKENITYLAHPCNLWCLIGGADMLPVPWQEEQ